MISLAKKKAIMIVMTILMVLTSIVPMFTSNFKSVEADLDPASKLICKFDDGKTFVNFYSTDYFHFLFRSKSAITSVQDVEGNLMNKLLSVSGFDFAKTNEAVLGRPLNPTEVPEESLSEANKSAPKVSAFDRFGMAGLSWSSYQGEWKYYHVDACATQDRVSPTTYGTFYENRLEPKSTYDETSTSVDPRSIQFNKGFASNLWTAFTDTLSNFLFTITKTIVTLTILFVGLAFTDITTMFGMLSSDGTAGGTASNIFSDLFDGIFRGFVLFTIMFTTIHLIYKGLIKRELRFALSSLLKIIAIFIVSIIIATNPSFWIGVPNKVATYGQALMLNSMAGMYEDDGQASLCTTNVASIGDNVNIDLSNPDSLKTEFEKTSQNMKSMIGCQMWETLLFKPWVKGQFGTEYTNLHAENLGNENEDWVGTPSVPLGGDTSIKNWGLFHLSTQTNAHAPLAEDSIPVLINDVNADWWRIVDAVSDYEEETATEGTSDGGTQEFKVPVAKAPTEYWQSWVGNNRAERVGVAFTSIIFGIVGSIAPLIFGLASAVFGLGITLLMVFSPVFLLFGTWSGKGHSIFMGWLAALGNTILKKIGAGLLLVLSLSLSMIIMDMIEDVGYITALILMILVSILLIKNKDKILNIMAGLNFGGAFDPRGAANRIINFNKSAAREVSRVGASAIGGGVAAHKSGQSVFTGAKVGVRSQLRNRLYTSQFGNTIIREADMQSNSEVLSRHTCQMCHMPLGFNKSELAYQDDDGNYLCVNCAEEMGIEKLYEVIVGQETKQESKVSDLIKNGSTDPIMPEDVRSINATLNRSWMSHGYLRKQMDASLEGENFEWNDEAVQKAIKQNMIGLHQDYLVFNNVQLKIGRRANPPSPPEPLHEYIDLALINMAWNDGRFDVIETTYKEAWKQWYEDNGQYVNGLTDEHIEQFKKEIDKEEIDIKETEARELLEEYMNKNTVGKAESVNDRSIYVYVGGKLVLNNEDIKNTDERLSD